MPSMGALAVTGAARVGQDCTLVAPLDDCPICFNELERPTRTPCLHWYCR